VAARGAGRWGQAGNERWRAHERGLARRGDVPRGEGHERREGGAGTDTSSNSA
jgi:hypothetical protein